MKKIQAIFSIIIISWSLCAGQKQGVLTNDMLGLKFISDARWTSISEDTSDEFVVVNRNHNIRVHVWHVKSNHEVTKCLDEVVLREGLCKLGEPFATKIGNKEATAIITGCVKLHQPYRELVMAVKNTDGYDIFSATCPEECFQEHCKQLKKLIMSFEYFEPSDSYAYFYRRAGEVRL